MCVYGYGVAMGVTQVAPAKFGARNTRSDKAYLLCIPHASTQGRIS